LQIAEEDLITAMARRRTYRSEGYLDLVISPGLAPLMSTTSIFLPSPSLANVEYLGPPQADFYAASGPVGGKHRKSQLSGTISTRVDRAVRSSRLVSGTPLREPVAILSSRWLHQSYLLSISQLMLAITLIGAAGMKDRDP
jgi:hypothetical protein